MALIDRASAAWRVLIGAEPQALVRSEPEGRLDLPTFRASGNSGSRGPSFQYLPSTPGTRKAARFGSWNLLESYNTIPALRTCVDLLAPAGARIQYEFYRVTKPSQRRNFERLQRAMGAEKERLRRAMVDAGDLEAQPDHPAAAFVMRGVPFPVLGFPVLTGFEARKLLYKFALLVGESLTLIERRGRGKGLNGRGEPWGNIPVVPTNVSGIPSANYPFYVIRDADGIEREIPAEDVLYRREVNPADPYGRGAGAAHSLSTELDIDEAQANHMAASWERGTRPDLLIVGDFGAEGAEGGTRLNRMTQRWDESVMRHKPHFLPYSGEEGHPVTVHDLSRTMEQMEANASRSATWSNIAQVIGRIPPELRGVTGNSNRATAQAGWYLLQTGILLSWAEEEAAFIRERILPEWPDEQLEVDYVSPVDRDWEFDLRVMTAKPAAFMLDEFRKRAGEEALPDGRGEVFLWDPSTVPVKDPSVDPLAGAGKAPLSPEPEQPQGDESESNGNPGPVANDGGGDPGEDGEGDVGAAKRAAHGSGQPLSRGGDLDPEAAFRGLSSPSEGVHGGVVARGDIADQGRVAERGQKGAVVEGKTVVMEGRAEGKAGESEFVHASTLVARTNDVKRAASYVTIDRIAASMEPRLRDLFLGAVERARGRVDEARLVAALADGNTARAIDLLEADQFGRDVRRASVALTEAFAAAGVAAAASLSEQLGTAVEFNKAGRRALTWGPQRSEDLARWARESVEESAREVMTHGEGEGWEAADTAGALALTLGLGAGLAVAVLRHRADLQASGETPDAAKLAAEDYRDSLIQHRAQMFGGDQAYSAAQAGQGESWLQAKEKGVLPANAKRYWVTRDDQKVCPTCDGLHGQKRDLSEPFVSPADGQSYSNAGPFDGPHDGCRCALLIVGVRGGQSD